MPTSTYFPPLISQWYSLVLGEVKNKMSSLWAFWLGLHQSASSKGIFLGVVWPLSCVWLFVTPWTVAHQAPLSMGFPAKNTGMGCHFLLQFIKEEIKEGANFSSTSDWQTGKRLIISVGKVMGKWALHFMMVGWKLEQLFGGRSSSFY